MRGVKIRVHSRISIESNAPNPNGIIHPHVFHEQGTGREPCLKGTQSYPCGSTLARKTRLSG